MIIGYICLMDRYLCCLLREEEEKGVGRRVFWMYAPDFPGQDTISILIKHSFELKTSNSFPLKQY